MTRGLMTRAAGVLIDRLARGESVHFGPGACYRPECGHAKVWHNPRNRTYECMKCGCGRYSGHGNGS